MMRVHVLQHVAFEGLGSMDDWFAARQAQVTWTRFYEGVNLPPLAGIDLLIILGGPMSIHDEAQFPWLQAEKRFIEEALRSSMAVLGICLGAQLLASVCGAPVTVAPHKEIGWFPIFGEAAGDGVFQFPAEGEAFHWHGETFDLPKGAPCLAHSAACAHQGFQWGKRVIGLQCHLEATPASTAAIMQHCADELVAGEPYIQTADVLRKVSDARYAALRVQMSRVLEYLLDCESSSPAHE
ncbi:MAG: type 1 glutamine amidotransferase [Acidithiobacillus sp.]